MRPTRDANTTGRRISKQIVNSADWNRTYHYYDDGQRMIETRNGSDQVLKQHVWGLTYVDELVQIAINQDPENASTGTYTENLCERPIWVLQDANFNVVGVVNHSGLLLERYEYTPYGQRTVFSRDYLLCDLDGDGDVDYPGDLGCFFNASSAPDSPADFDGDGVVNRTVGQGDRAILDADTAVGPSSTADALVSYPRLESSRGWSSSALIPLATGICDVGHQGLLLDKEFGLYYNRARYHHPRLGRFVQRDPSVYTDGMSLYEYEASDPLTSTDPLGLQTMRRELAITGPDDTPDFLLDSFRKECGHSIHWYKNMTFAKAKKQALPRLRARRESPWVKPVGVFTLRKVRCEWENCGKVEGPHWKDFGAASQVWIGWFESKVKLDIKLPNGLRIYRGTHIVHYRRRDWRVRRVYYFQWCDEVCYYTTRGTDKKCRYSSKKARAYGTSDKFINTHEERGKLSRPLTKKVRTSMTVTVFDPVDAEGVANPIQRQPRVQPRK